MNTAPETRQRILVVCLGKYCRSPMAAAALSRYCPPGTEIRSAGLAAKHAGKPADPAMVAAAARIGYDLTSHRGRQVDSGLLAWAGVVLAMDSQVLDTLRWMPASHPHPELRLYLGDEDVPDPLGCADSVFDACAAMIEARAREFW